MQYQVERTESLAGLKRIYYDMCMPLLVKVCIYICVLRCLLTWSPVFSFVVGGVGCSAGVLVLALLSVAARISDIVTFLRHLSFNIQYCTNNTTH